MRGLILATLFAAAHGYFLGETEGDPNFHKCWQNGKLMARCPAGIKVNWNFGEVTTNKQWIEGEDSTVTVHTDWPQQILDTMVGQDGVDIPHLNLHACRKERGVCIPAYSPQGELVTHAPALSGARDDDFVSSIRLTAGDWNVIAHVRTFLTDTTLYPLVGEDTATVPELPWKLDVAIGAGAHVLPRVITVNDIVVSMPSGNLSAGMACTVVVWVVILACVAYTVVKRDEKIIKGFQWRFMIMASIGCGIMITSTIFFAMDEGNTDAASLDLVCQLRAFLPAVGFSLFFCAIAAKLFRVQRIFAGAEKMKGVVITDFDLFKYTIVPIGLVLVAVIVWAAVDPPLRHVDISPLIETDDPLVNDQILTGSCVSGGIGEMIGTVLLIFCAIIVIVACNWAWETRNVWLPAVNDSTQISYVALMTCVIGAFEVIVVYMTEDEATVFVLVLVGALIEVLFYLGSSYGLKIFVIVMGKQAEWELQANPGTIKTQAATKTRIKSRAQPASDNKSEIAKLKGENKKLKTQLADANSRICDLEKGL